MPEDETRINQALVKAALMKRVESSKVKQLSLFDFKEAEAELKPLQAQWQNALEKAKANRTIFAQRRIRPDEVMPEWEKQQNALGTEDDVKRFVKTACARLNAPLELGKRNNYKLLPQHFPEAFKKRLFDEGIEKPLLLNFKYLHRSHPVVTLLAEYLLEDALTSENPLAARCAVTVTEAVDVVTTLYVLRLRHQLSYVRRRQPYQLMAEETVTLAVRGRSKPEWLIDEETDNLLKCEPSGNLPVDVMRREIKQALDFIQSQSNYIESLAKSRSEILLSDHQRVREAARDVGQYNVSPCLPVDVIGVYVLLPDAL
jgi:hypothetical protein